MWSVLPISTTVFAGHRTGVISKLELNQFVVLKELTFHQSYVNVIVQLQVKNMMASGSSDCTIAIWDYKNCTLVRSLIGHANIIWDIVSLS